MDSAGKRQRPVMGPRDHCRYNFESHGRQEILKSARRQSASH